jgi:hypothetical protein
VGAHPCLENVHVHVVVVVWFGEAWWGVAHV